VRSALESKLLECMLGGTAIDSITFAGDGEPTLNPEFPRVVQDAIVLRDAFFPGAKLSVLSNATTLDRPEVLEALKKVDQPVMKLDAPTTELARLINIPYQGYDVAKVVENLRSFEGNFILQTMFLKYKDFDSSSPEVLNGWMDIVRSLKPREIMVYTIDRPTPAAGIVKFTEQQMRSLVEPLIKEGFNIQVKA